MCTFCDYFNSLLFWCQLQSHAERNTLTHFDSFMGCCCCTTSHSMVSIKREALLQRACTWNLKPLSSNDIQPRLTRPQTTLVLIRNRLTPLAYPQSGFAACLLRMSAISKVTPYYYHTRCAVMFQFKRLQCLVIFVLSICFYSILQSNSKYEHLGVWITLCSVQRALWDCELDSFHINSHQTVGLNMVGH